MKWASLSSQKDFSHQQFKMSQNLKDYFHNLGFNIFLSAPVSSIPDDIYPFSDEQKKKTLLMIGSGGNTLWSKIPDTRIPDCLDKYSINALKVFKAPEVLNPHPEIILPLQQLMRIFNFSHPTPIGIDISREFGLWFAIRAVVLVDSPIKDYTHPEYLSPCIPCTTKLCTTESDLSLARLLCPYQAHEKYSLRQREYHQKILTRLASVHAISQKN